MRSVVLGVDDLAIEYGKAADQRRRAARNVVPFSQRESFLDRQAGLARKAFGERQLVVGQRVQREIAVSDESFILQILSVEADQHRRRRVGHGTGGDRKSTRL